MIRLMLAVLCLSVCGCSRYEYLIGKTVRVGAGGTIGPHKYTVVSVTSFKTFVDRPYPAWCVRVAPNGDLIAEQFPAPLLWTEEDLAPVEPAEPEPRSYSLDAIFVMLPAFFVGLVVGLRIRRRHTCCTFCRLQAEFDAHVAKSVATAHKEHG